MPRLEDQILANAQTLNRLRAEASRTAYEQRNKDEAARRAAWGAYRDRYGALSFPGGAEGWRALLAGETTSADAALAFLSADPWFFRSGYMKSRIWQRLKRMGLNRHQEKALEEIALARLQAPARPDFWDMARCMRFRGTPRFWEAVAALARAHAHDRGGTKAQWLLLARANHPVRRWLGEELRRRAQGQPHDFTFARRIAAPR
jgi:hypothetical protein